MVRLSALVLAFWCGLAAGGARAETRLVMFGTADCGGCRVFYLESLQDYWTSEESTAMPLSIVDAAALGTAGNALRAPLSTYPTFVLMRDGREIGRIDGYPGREVFFATMADWRRQLGD
jgi:hypothetical protein